MKDRKKQRGTKAEIRAYKKRLQYITTVITVAILIAIIAIASFLIYSYLKPSSNQTPSPTTQLKAAMVDQLSLSQPDPTFNQTAANILKEAGWTVDYYPSEEVTVKFYKNLPTHDYGLIVLRVHSALRDPEGRPSVLFTSQNYSNKEYRWEQIDDRIVPVAYSHEHFERGEVYFGITPEFVKQNMKGTFVNTTIIMMGCNGLTYTEMAQAFTEEKGAKVYISWSEAVSISHTDQATIQLLEHLITEKKGIKEAVDEISLDLTYNSRLDYYPKTVEVENYVIPEPKSNLTTNVAETNLKIEKFEKTSIK